jgi:hypothetical protein
MNSMELPLNVITAIFSKMVRRLGDVLPLKVFIRRQQVLNLYRTLVREGKRADLHLGGNDIVKQIKEEFNNNRGVTNASLISSLIVDGSRQVEALRAIGKGAGGTGTGTGAEEYDSSSWINSGDDDDVRGRVGEQWPWSR